MLRLLFGSIVFVVGFGSATWGLGQTPVDLSGPWKSSEGDVQVIQNGASIQAKLTSNSQCPYGGPRDNYFQGTLQGNTLRGTILLCTHSKQLHDDCHLNDPYSAEFEATIASDSIRGTYRPDYINYDTKDGHYVNCRITPRGGSDRSFDLTRSDCCDQVQQLQQQVKALNDRLQQLEQKLNGPDVTLGSGSSSIHMGSDGISINSDRDITIKGTRQNR